jgi:hypothetical protein
MEDVVDAGIGRKAEAVGDLANAFRYLKRSSIMRPELAACARGQ